MNEQDLTEREQQQAEFDRKVDEVREQCRREWIEQGLDTP